MYCSTICYLLSHAFYNMIMDLYSKGALVDQLFKEIG